MLYIHLMQPPYPEASQHAVVLLHAGFLLMPSQLIQITHMLMTVRLKLQYVHMHFCSFAPFSTHMWE